MSNSIPYDINFNSNSIGNAFTFNSSGTTFNGSLSGNTNALLKNQNNMCTDTTSISYTKNSDNSIATSILALAEDISTLSCSQSDTGTKIVTTSSSVSCTPDSTQLQYIDFSNNAISSSPNILLSDDGIQICSSLGITTPSSRIVLSPDGTVLLDTTKTVPTSLTDIGTAGEIRFDDTNGILYRCTTTGTTSGSGKWDSYYSTTTAPIVQGSNTLTTTLELKNSDGSEFAFNGTTFTINQNSSNSVMLSPSQFNITNTNSKLLFDESSFNVYWESNSFLVSENGLNWTGNNSSFTCSENGLSYSTTEGSVYFNINEDAYSLTINNSHIVFEPNEAFKISLAETDSPSFNFEVDLSNNNLIIGHFGVVNSNGTHTKNTLPSYTLSLQGATLPILDMYSTQLSSANVVQSVKNSDGSYSPYITGLKTDTTTGNLGIYSNSTSPVIVVGTNNSLTVSGEFSCDNGKITTDGSGHITIADNGNITTGAFGSIVVGKEGNISCTSGKITGQDVHATSTLTIPSTIYSALPTSPTAGMMFLVTNGCKPGEATGKGTGCLCVYDGSNWMNVSSGTTVTI